MLGMIVCLCGGRRCWCVLKKKSSWKQNRCFYAWLTCANARSTKQEVKQLSLEVDHISMCFDRVLESEALAKLTTTDFCGSFLEQLSVRGRSVVLIFQPQSVGIFSHDLRVSVTNSYPLSWTCIFFHGLTEALHRDP